MGAGSDEWFREEAERAFGNGEKAVKPAERQEEAAPKAFALGAAMVFWIVGVVTTPYARVKRLGLGFTTVL